MVCSLELAVTKDEMRLTRKQMVLHRFYLQRGMDSWTTDVRLLLGMGGTRCPKNIFFMRSVVPVVLRAWSNIVKATYRRLNEWEESLCQTSSTS